MFKLAPESILPPMREISIERVIQGTQINGETFINVRPANKKGKLLARFFTADNQIITREVNKGQKVTIRSNGAW